MLNPIDMSIPLPQEATAGQLLKALSDLLVQPTAVVLPVQVAATLPSKNPVTVAHLLTALYNLMEPPIEVILPIQHSPVSAQTTAEQLLIELSDLMLPPLLLPMVEATFPSKTKSGATTLQLLAALSNLLIPPKAVPLPAPARAKPLAGKRIFILEDDLDAMTIASYLLRSAGATVMFESKGYMTVALLMRMRPIDLVILDLTLPGIHGFTAYANIKTFSVFDGLKAICCTASHEKAREAKLLGFDGFISKPIVPHQFVSQVAEVLAGTSPWVQS